MAVIDLIAKDLEMEPKKLLEESLKYTSVIASLKWRRKYFASRRDTV